MDQSYSIRQSLGIVTAIHAPTGVARSEGRCEARSAAVEEDAASRLGDMRIPDDMQKATSAGAARGTVCVVFSLPAVNCETNSWFQRWAHSTAVAN